MKGKHVSFVVLHDLPDEEIDIALVRVFTLLDGGPVEGVVKWDEKDLEEDVVRQLVEEYGVGNDEEGEDL